MTYRDSFHKVYIPCWIYIHCRWCCWVQRSLKW